MGWPGAPVPDGHPEFPDVPAGFARGAGRFAVAGGDSDFRLAKGESAPSLAAPFFFLWQTVGAPVSVRIFIGAIAGRKTKPTTNP
jgi:hypothetical protein